MVPFQPAQNLRSRTFLGLLVAQFLAAFNDQAIHASAMFFAIKTRALTEDDAISLMPILFYAPWALFATLAGWLADRFSKRQALVFWKVAEVGITLIALAGFWLGTRGFWIGPWLVLSTVFLMGTHSAFFVPAKYGAMPEILPSHLLSRGNGLLESLSFLAVILGTVGGGVMSSPLLFKDREYYIGLVLLALALVGAGASFLIEKMPAANPTRPFPANLFKPVWDNLLIMLRSRPLALAVLGIAFFTFMVAFMRGTMYMHGETRNPQWDELHTSIVVGVVALGVGLGSPLAGFLSSGKVELGMVPLGALGMILALVVAAFTLNNETMLVGCLVAVGFFTGFYIVPLFTLLQHRAPKANKGDLLASSNLINVTGAIAASFLFKALVWGAQWAGVTAAIKPELRVEGTLLALGFDSQGKPARFEVGQENGAVFRRGSRRGVEVTEDGETVDKRIIEFNGKLVPQTRVRVVRYPLKRQGKDVTLYLVQPASVPVEDFHNKEPLTPYLFLAAACMTLTVLALLYAQLPDFFVRALLWLSTVGRYRQKVVGMLNLPDKGPVVVVANGDDVETCLQVLGATDRWTRFLLVAPEEASRLRGLFRRMVVRNELAVLPATGVSAAQWQAVRARAARTLARGGAVGVPLSQYAPADPLSPEAGAWRAAPVVPIYCEISPLREGHWRQRVLVLAGPALPPGATAGEVGRALERLPEEYRDGEDREGQPAEVLSHT